MVFQFCVAGNVVIDSSPLGNATWQQGFGNKKATIQILAFIQQTFNLFLDCSLRDQIVTLHVLCSLSGHLVSQTTD